MIVLEYIGMLILGIVLGMFAIGILVTPIIGAIFLIGVGIKSGIDINLYSGAAIFVIHTAISGRIQNEMRTV